MTWDFLAWLFIFVLQAGVLGLVMYVIICLSDLEVDFINPHDCCRRVNRFLVPYLIAQCLLAALLLSIGAWFTGAINTSVAAFQLRRYFRGRLTLDVTEIFNQLPEHKKCWYFVLAAELACFVITIYRLVRAAVAGLLSDEGRSMAKTMFREAAMGMYPQMHM